MSLGKASVLSSNYVLSRGRYAREDIFRCTEDLGNLLTSRRLAGTKGACLAPRRATAWRLEITAGKGVSL